MESPIVESSSISVRATIRLRNNAMIEARHERGWTQAQLGALVGVSQTVIGELERFDWRCRNSRRYAEEVAAALDISVESIMPDGVEGQHVDHTSVHIGRVRTEQMLAYRDHLEQRMLVPPPGEAQERDELIRRALETISYRERDVLKLRYGLFGGLAYSLEECGKRFNISRERVRQIELKALRNLRANATTSVLGPLFGDQRKQGDWEQKGVA